MKLIKLKMNVPAEKLSLIEWLIHLQDQKILDKIKALKDQSEISGQGSRLDPVLLDKLVARALKSEQAIASGQVSDIESIMKEDWD